jgi:hypothetical protein
MSKRIFAVAIMILVLLPGAAFAQGRAVGRAVRHPLLWILNHHSVIAPDGTFIKLVKEEASTGASDNSSDSNHQNIIWKLEVVDFGGHISYTTLPGYPSHFEVGESGLLYITIPDPTAWKNRAPGQFPANAKTTLYIVPDPYLDVDPTLDKTFEVNGFVGSLRIRKVLGVEYAYMTARNLAENPTTDTEENELDHHLVVVNSLTGKLEFDVNLNTK